jgi:Na+/melibiose symporter-like transporter
VWLGLAFFAAVNGLAYVISLFFQTALGLSPPAAAIALSPLMAGIIVCSIVCRPLVTRLGRVLVVIGLGITLVGAAGLWATVLAEGTAVSVWALAPSILVLSAGMGACFSSIYDVAIGDVAPAEAGSASGSLSAVQQLAAAIGSAVVTRRGARSPRYFRRTWPPQPSTSSPARSWRRPTGSASHSGTS